MNSHPCYTIGDEKMMTPHHKCDAIDMLPWSTGPGGMIIYATVARWFTCGFVSSILN